MNNATALIEQLNLLIPPSLDWLAVNKVPNLLYIPFGIIGTTCSLAALVVFARLWSTGARNAYTINVINIAAADLLICIAHTCVGLKRTLLAYTGNHEVSAPIYCAMEQNALLFGNLTSMGQTAALAIDRLISIAFPVWYFTQRKRLLGTVLINGVFWLFPVGFLGYLITGRSQDAYISNCPNGITFQLWAGTILSNFQIGYVLLVLALNLGIFALAMCLFKLAKTGVHQNNVQQADGDGLANAQRRKQRHITKTSLVVGLAFVSTWGFSFVYIQVVNYAFASGRKYLFTIIPLFIMSSPTINVFVYYLLDKNFKAVIRRSMAKKAPAIFATSAGHNSSLQSSANIVVSDTV